MSVGRNSAYNLAGSIIPVILALVTIPFYLQLVGTERYGVLAIAWLVLGYFGVFDLGLGPATAQRIATLADSTPEHRARVFWTAAAVNVCIGTVGSVLLFFAAGYFFTSQLEADPDLIAEMLEALPWLAIAVPVATLAGVGRGALQGRDKFLDANIVNVIGSTLFQLLPLMVAFVIGPTLKWLIISALIARVAGLLIFYTRVHHHLLRGIRPSFDRTEWLSLFKFGGWVTISTMVGPLIVAADRLLVGSLIGAVSVAIYSVAFDIAGKLSLIPNAFGLAAFPQFAQRDAKSNHLLMMRAMGALSLILTAPVVAGLFLVEPLLVLWLGEENGLQVSVIAGLLLIAYWGNAFAVTPFVRIQGQGRPDIVAWATLGQAPLHIAALYFATDAFGLIGTAAVVALRCNLEVLLLLYLVERKIVLPLFHLLAIPIMLAAYILSQSTSVLTPLGFSVMTALTLAGFAISWFSVTDESRQDFKGLLGKTLEFGARFRT